MLRRLAALAIGLVPVLVLAGYALANSGERQIIRDVRAANEQFRDVPTAESAGYGLFVDKDGIACISLSGVGGMGVHYVNGQYVGDAVIDPLKPEAMVYVQGGGGSLKLGAIEYIVFQEAWEAEHGAGADPPRLFDTDFDLTPAGNRFGIPAFYALHAWLYRGNPAGQLTPWNPRVTCPSLTLAGAMCAVGAG
jgi:hypothetical protein